MEDEYWDDDVVFRCPICMLEIRSKILRRKDVERDSLETILGEANAFQITGLRHLRDHHRLEIPEESIDKADILFGRGKEMDV